MGSRFIADKIDVYSEENIAKRSYWLEVCAKCHSDRFADTYLKSLDEFYVPGTHPGRQGHRRSSRIWLQMAFYILAPPKGILTP